MWDGQTAQGLYNLCTPVSSAQAKPGDLIFFVGTYDTAGVSHVGIYVGGGMMIHCGDPISYADVNTSYWQSHYFQFWTFTLTKISIHFVWKGALIWQR